jgi:autotransporter-associated beta strand protein
MAGLIFALGVAGPVARAAVYTWSGGGGANANWNLNANWGYTGVPGNGDTVVLPAGQPNLVNSNNLTGLALSQIIFEGGGYDIRGNGITLSNALVATNLSGANLIEAGLALAGTNVQIYVGSGANLVLEGQLAGTAGVTKTGTGNLTYQYAGDNTYLGSTLVSGGTLLLNVLGADAFGGSLVIGDGSGTGGPTVELLQSAEIPATPITVNQGGTLNLNNENQTIGTNLTLNGGTVVTGSGTLSLPTNGVIMVGGTSASSISGNLNVGPTNTTCRWTNSAALILNASVTGAAEIINTGPGQTYLEAGNSFLGALIIQQGWVYAENNYALGATSGSVMVTNNASLVLAGSVAVTNKTLILSGTGTPGTWGALDVETGTNIWAGPVVVGANSTLDAWQTNAQLHISGPISGPGGLELFGNPAGGGTHFFEGSAANTYAGLTTVDAGSTLLLNKTSFVIGVPANLAVSGTVRLENSEEIDGGADLQINSGGLFDLGAYVQDLNTLHGTGNVTVGSDGWLDIGAAGGSSEFDGLISGTGYAGGYTLNKLGAGTFRLTANNTYANGNQVTAGTLIIDGQQPQNPTLIESGATLSGTGAVGVITNNGSIAPGDPVGILHSSNVVFTATGNLTVQLNGPVAGSGYDQLNVTGSNTLKSASLIVVPAFATAPPAGQQFVIIHNEATNNGTFNGQPEGSIVSAGGYKFQISYVGGAGNDVVLTVISNLALVVSAAVTAGDGSHNLDPNDCNNFSLVVSNETGTVLSNLTAVLSTTTEGVIISQPYSSYPNLGAGGAATNLAPFQISVLSNVLSGSSIELQLTLASSLGASTMTYAVAAGGRSGSGICDLCHPAITNAVTAGDPVQSGQCLGNAVAASFGAPKAWPGTVAGGFHYVVYLFTNTSPAAAAVTVELQSASNLMAVAYLYNFNPALVSSNYLGDAGSGTRGGSTTFSCDVAAGALFQVVVSEVVANAGTQPFTLQLAGLPCPPPGLNIQAVATNQARLSWDTAAGGYVLEGGTNLLAPVWGAVTNEPIVSGGQYAVTNSEAGANDRFYRLHKH